MKKTYLLFILLFGLSTQIFGQVPGIEWKKSYWATESPTGQTQIPQHKSGEDWFYDIKINKNNFNVVDGYIVGGYSTFVNWMADQPLGCYERPLYPPKKKLFESKINYRGNLLATMARIDLYGNKIWLQAYNEGWFYKVIQTSDGGYLGIGVTRATQNRNGSMLAYNPNRTPGQINNGLILDQACTVQQHDIRKTYVVKTAANGDVEWEYIYGMEPFINGGKEAYENTTMGWDVVETPSGEFLLTGCATIDTNSTMRTFVIKIGNNGYWKWGKSYGPLTKGSIGTAIGKYTFGLQTKFIVAGEEEKPPVGTSVKSKAFAFQIGDNALPNIEWYGDYGDVFNQSVRISDLAINNSTNELFLPIGTNHLNVGHSHTAVGKVFKVNALNGQTIGSPVDFGAIKAYDLKLGITATTDGGFAVVSTKQPNPLNHPPNTQVTYNFDYWRTDAYLAKYDANNAQEWEMTFDSNTVTPPGTYLLWDYPDPDMRDLKRQECMYAIVQAPDGGFVIAGNNSANFDDSYLAKTTGTIPFSEEKQNLKDLKVYPNPSRGLFQLESEDKMLSWNLSNQLGTIVLTGKVNKEDPNKVSIDIRQLPTGVYFVKALFEDGEILSRTIINE